MSTNIFGSDLNSMTKDLNKLFASQSGTKARLDAINGGKTRSKDIRTPDFGKLLDEAFGGLQRAGLGFTY